MAEIRVANVGDAPALRALYGQYINTPVTFEYRLPTAAEFVRRVVGTLRDYPWLIGAADDGRILGYACAHRMQAREAYQWGAELSVYLDRAAVGRGLGTELYSRLLELLRAQGGRTVYGCVTVPNRASERLHEKLGFARCGLFHRAGFKNGVWHDIVWFEKALAEYDAPAPFLPFSRLHGE